MSSHLFPEIFFVQKQNVSVENKKASINLLLSDLYRSLSVPGAELLLNSLTIFVKTAYAFSSIHLCACQVCDF